MFTIFHSKPPESYVYYSLSFYPTSFSALKIHPCYCKNTTDNAVSIQCENTNLASLSLALGSLAADSIPIKELLINDSNFREYIHFC